MVNLNTGPRETNSLITVSNPSSNKGDKQYPTVNYLLNADREIDNIHDLNNRQDLNNKNKNVPIIRRILPKTEGDEIKEINMGTKDRGIHERFGNIKIPDNKQYLLLEDLNDIQVEEDYYVSIPFRYNEHNNKPFDKNLNFENKGLYSNREYGSSLRSDIRVINKTI